MQLLWLWVVVSVSGAFEDSVFQRRSFSQGTVSGVRGHLMDRVHAAVEAEYSSQQDYVIIQSKAAAFVFSSVIRIFRTCPPALFCLSRIGD